MISWTKRISSQLWQFKCFFTEELSVKIHPGSKMGHHMVPRLLQMWCSLYMGSVMPCFVQHKCCSFSQKMIYFPRVEWDCTWLYLFTCYAEKRLDSLGKWRLIFHSNMGHLGWWRLHSWNENMDDDGQFKNQNYPPFRVLTLKPVPKPYLFKHLCWQFPGV